VNEIPHRQEGRHRPGYNARYRRTANTRYHFRFLLSEDLVAEYACSDGG
jgi:hypothetical protein